MKAYQIAMLAVASTGYAIAQDVPPPPKPQDGGPSLEATMKFLQDKLSTNMNFILYIHDNVAGTDWHEKRAAELSNVSAEGGRCRIGFHERVTVNGTTTSDREDGFPLRQVQEIKAMPGELLLKQVASKAGHPEWSYTVDPPAFVLIVKTSDGWTNDFDFDDEALSHRVAKALQHAVELCGGGSQEPF